MRRTNLSRVVRPAATVLALGIGSAGCSGGGDEPAPAGFGKLSGQTVLVLPVQYVVPAPGGYAGGASNPGAAARLADSEIAFALSERAGRATWVMPQQQIEALKRRPWMQVNPLALSADEVRSEGDKLRDIRDPLYREIRMIAALFDARLAVWPLEIFYEKGAEGHEGHGGRLAIRTVLLDARAGVVLWQGLVRGDDQPPTSPGALAAAAQAFAIRVSP